MIKRNKVIAGITALTVVLSSGAVAFAATDTAETQSKEDKQAVMSSLTEAQKEAVSQARTESMQEAAAGLVDSGVITEDLADELTAIKCVSKSDAVERVLTDEQRTALHEEEQAIFETLVSDLVENGTLTQNLADQMEAGKKMLRGLNLTDEQKQAVMQARIDAREQAAASLVETGTITQEEADTIASMPKVMIKKENPASSLTEEQKTALSEAFKTALESKLAELVGDGTITQEQADQLLEGKVMFRMGPGMKRPQDSSGQSAPPA